MGTRSLPVQNERSFFFSSIVISWTTLQNHLSRGTQHFLSVSRDIAAEMSLWSSLDAATLSRVAILVMRNPLQSFEVQVSTSADEELKLIRDKHLQTGLNETAPFITSLLAKTKIPSRSHHQPPCGSRCGTLCIAFPLLSPRHTPRRVEQTLKEPALDGNLTVSFATLERDSNRPSRFSFVTGMLPPLSLSSTVNISPNTSCCISKVSENVLSTSPSKSRRF